MTSSIKTPEDLLVYAIGTMLVTWLAITYIPFKFYHGIMALSLVAQVLTVFLLILDSSLIKRWVRWVYAGGEATCIAFAVSIFACMVKGYTNTAIILATTAVLQFFIWLYWIADYTPEEKSAQ